MTETYDRSVSILMLPASNHSIYRILDASINRASEGLRVVEDYVRMSLNDAHLTQRLKQLRHQLIVATTGGIDQEKLIAARDTQQDVGTAAETNSEYERKTEAGIVQSNMSRLQQSLRTIEEYSKTIAADTARQIEQIRYVSYTLEKAIVTTMMSLRNLGDARICVLIDARDDMPTFAQRVTQLIESGVDLIQLRDKNQEARDLVAYGKRLSELTKGTATRWIMNDRADLAMATDADGVHVGQTDLAVSDVRRIVGAVKIIGVSTHNIQQARQAVLDAQITWASVPSFLHGPKRLLQSPGWNSYDRLPTRFNCPRSQSVESPRQMSPKLFSMEYIASP